MISLSRLRHPIRYLALGAWLSVPALAPQPGWAQPPGGNRNMVPPAPVPPAPPLTPEELQTLTGGPTLVTYSGQNVPVDDVLKALMLAAGVETRRPNVRLQEGNAPTISVDWKEKPFWDAAREVETLTGLRWLQSLTGGLDLLPPTPANGGNLNGPLVAETPFVKIYADSVTHTTVSKAPLLGKEETKPASNHSTQLRVVVYYDPKIKVQKGSLSVRDIGLPQGTALLPENPTLNPVKLDIVDAAMPYIRRGAVLIEPLVINLPAGLPSQTTLAKVSARARFSSNVGDKKWLVDDLLNAADAQETVGKARFTVDHVEVVGKQLKVRLEVERDDIPEGGPMMFDFGVANAAGGNGNRPNVVIPDLGAFNGVPQMAIPNMVIPNMAEGGLLEDGIRNNINRWFRGGPQNRTFSEIVVKDAQGRPLANRGMSSVNRGERGKTQNTLTFDLGDAPATGPFSMEWTLAAPPRTVEMPFELENVRIP